MSSHLGINPRMVMPKFNQIVAVSHPRRNPKQHPPVRRQIR